MSQHVAVSKNCTRRLWVLLRSQSQCSVQFRRRSMSKKVSDLLRYVLFVHLHNVFVLTTLSLGWRGERGGREGHVLVKVTRSFFFFFFYFFYLTWK